MFTVLKTKCLIINNKISKVLGIYCDIYWVNEEVLQVFNTALSMIVAITLVCVCFFALQRSVKSFHKSLFALPQSSESLWSPSPPKKTSHTSINRKSALKVFYQLILHCEYIMWCENTQSLTCLHSKSNTNSSTFLTDMHAKKTFTNCSMQMMIFKNMCRKKMRVKNIKILSQLH